MPRKITQVVMPRCPWGLKGKGTCTFPAGHLGCHSYQRGDWNGRARQWLPNDTITVTFEDPPRKR